MCNRRRSVCGKTVETAVGINRDEMVLTTYGHFNFFPDPTTLFHGTFEVERCQHHDKYRGNGNGFLDVVTEYTVCQFFIVKKYFVISFFKFQLQDTSILCSVFPAITDKNVIFTFFHIMWSFFIIIPFIDYMLLTHFFWPNIIRDTVSCIYHLINYSYSLFFLTGLQT